MAEWVSQREIFNLLVHISNDCNRGDWVSLNPGAGNSLCPHMGEQELKYLGHHLLLPRRAGSKVEGLGSRSRTLRRDVGIPTGCLTGWTTVPALYELLEESPYRNRFCQYEVDVRNNWLKKPERAFQRKKDISSEYSSGHDPRQKGWSFLLCYFGQVICRNHI